VTMKIVGKLIPVACTIEVLRSQFTFVMTV
jgi:hypothetical protein